MLEVPFRGSVAVADGRLTRSQLYGPRYRRVFPDVFVPAGLTVDLAVRSRAAYLYVADRGGVLAGYSAAELLGAGCALRRVAAEVLVPRDVRRRDDLLVRRGTATGDDVDRAGGCLVTSARRTAWDLARRLPLVPAVVAVDALSRRGRFRPGVLLDRRRARSCRKLDQVVALADPRAESVMESRLRLHLVLAGLPAPEVQYRVVDAHGFVLARVDLAYPQAKLAIEYDGTTHFTDAASRRDRRRDLNLSRLGWYTVRLTYDDVDNNPASTPRQIADLLAERTPSSSTPVRLRS